MAAVVAVVAFAAVVAVAETFSNNICASHFAQKLAHEELELNFFAIGKSHKAIQFGSYII